MKNGILKRIQRRADKLGMTTIDYVGCIIFVSIGALIIFGGLVLILIARH